MVLMYQRSSSPLHPVSATTPERGRPAGRLFMEWWNQTSAAQKAAAPPLLVRTRAGQRSLPPGPAYLVGRDPEADIVIPDACVSWQHAVLRRDGGRWVLADNGSSNGTFVNEQPITSATLADGDMIGFGDTTFLLAGDELTELAPSDPVAPVAPVVPAAPEVTDENGPLEIPYAIRWLVPRGERFANFDILNDNDTQLDYFRRFGHIYAVGIPTKKWRLVVVSDPELLDQVAGNEDQFGKPIEEINFFAQLQNTRGQGISVIGDGEHYEHVRRVMLPWYSPQNQRTQLPMMKEQA